VSATDAEGLRERLVADWWDTYDQLGATSTVMVALRRADIDDLNVRARARLAADGQLTGAELSGWRPHVPGRGPDRVPA
jgi:hypothetical protein